MDPQHFDETRHFRIGRKERGDEAPVGAQRQEASKRQHAGTQRGYAFKPVSQTDRSLHQRTGNDIQPDAAKPVADYGMLREIVSAGYRQPLAEYRRIKRIAATGRGWQRFDLERSGIEFGRPDEPCLRPSDLGVLGESGAPTPGRRYRPIPNASPRSRAHTSRYIPGRAAATPMQVQPGPSPQAHGNAADLTIGTEERISGQSVPALPQGNS